MITYQASTHLFRLIQYCVLEIENKDVNLICTFGLIRKVNLNSELSRCNKPIKIQLDYVKF